MKNLIVLLFSVVLGVWGLQVSRAETAVDIGTGIFTHADQAPAAEVIVGDETDIGVPGDPSEVISFKDFISQNWKILLSALMVALGVVVRLTPSKKDNDIFNFIKKLLDTFIPNNRSGGGLHK